MIQAGACLESRDHARSLSVCTAFPAYAGFDTPSFVHLKAGCLSHKKLNGGYPALTLC
ncbi:hypothetical protein P3T23_002685 [Paraburkholderia sp. GAS448]